MLRYVLLTYSCIYLTLLTWLRGALAILFTMTIRAARLFIPSARAFIQHLRPMGFKKWREKGVYRLRYLICFWYIIETKDVAPVKQVTYLSFTFDWLEGWFLLLWNKGRTWAKNPLFWAVVGHFFVNLAQLHGNYGAVIKKRLRGFNFGIISNQKSVLSCKRAVRCVVDDNVDCGFCRRCQT